MSDGSLSQEEIDSLLSGLDSGGPAPAAKSSAPGPSREVQAWREILEGTLEGQSQNIAMMTGADARVSGVKVELLSRDAFLQSTPQEVLSYRVDFTGGVPGEHVFVIPKDSALRIAGLVIKEDGLSELSDMAVSAVGELMSTMTGALITTLSDKSGSRGIQSSTAEGSFGPKAMVKVPSGDFIRASYQVEIGPNNETIVEVFAAPFVRDLVAATGGGDQGGMSMNMNQGSQQAGMNGQQQMGGYGGNPGGMQGMMGAPQGGYAPMGMYGGQAPMMGMSPPNVQPVQFANLAMRQASPEAGNIGLIMDVFMEMTVELGRTRKLIREILGMGEGTIIELDKLAGEPVDILVNHKLIAKGEVVVIDENFGVRVTEIVSPMERMADLA
ncbi:MAG: flagellar motor switch protein FliN [Spirochaetales bacterium]|nr:flagellar motor switch protein FliN [Spirochaetales bacterium]